MHMPWHHVQWNCNDNKGNSDYKTRQQNYNMISATENIVSACLIKSITDLDIGNYGQIIDN